VQNGVKTTDLYLTRVFKTPLKPGSRMQSSLSSGVNSGNGKHLSGHQRWENGNHSSPHDSRTVNNIQHPGHIPGLRASSWH